MRAHGVVDSANDLGVHDHVCWVFDDRETFVAEAVDFLARGIELGQRVAYITDVDTGSSVTHQLLAPLGDIGALVASGQLQVLSMAAMYEQIQGATPAMQAREYERAVAAAVADGFAGLRVAVDATPLVTDPSDRDAFVRYEHLVDRLVAGGLQFAAMCGYDRTKLGDSQAAELAAVHPVTHGSPLGFALFSLDVHDLALVGETDAMSADDFGHAVRRVLTSHSGSTVSIDCSGLGFIDHTCLVALDRHARDATVNVRLVDVAPVVRRLSSVIDLVAVEVAAR